VPAPPPVIVAPLASSPSGSYLDSRYIDDIYIDSKGVTARSAAAAGVACPGSAGTWNPFEEGATVAGSDIYRGTLNLLILQTLTMGPLHGYGISAVIREQSDGILDPGEGVLYPALRRMEKRGLVGSEWGETSTGRRARFYTLTDRGRKALAAEIERWEGHVGAVAAVLRHARR
jgi:PadR family transcriptional regulator PadR